MPSSEILSKFESIINSVRENSDIHHEDLMYMISYIAVHSNDNYFMRKLQSIIPLLNYFPNIQNCYGENSIYFERKNRAISLLQIVYRGKVYSMYTEPIAKTYFLMEMARYQAHEDNPLRSSKESRMRWYFLSKMTLSKPQWVMGYEFINR